jgi:DNA invertase Pin-like site-specific DNA recombinase
VRAIAYARVSTDEQARSGLSLDHQAQVIEAEAHRRGWTVEHLTDAGYSAASVARRPALRQALSMLASREADVLMVARLDRLSRSVIDAARLIEQAKREGWALVILDLGADTSTPAGALATNVVASVAQYERELIAARTSDAMQQAKRRGRRLGRPVSLPQPVRERVLTDRESGLSLRVIADRLNVEQVPTAQGGRWHASTVRHVLMSLDLDEQAARQAEEAGSR